MNGGEVRASGDIAPPMAQESHSNHDSIYAQIQMAMQVKTSTDFWVTVTRRLTREVSVIAIPFTLGTSLLAFLAVATIAAIDCTARERKSQTELLNVIASTSS